ncbi:MAG: GAF domain-containing sensor histidine kinase [Anaerolineales bacterium]
MDDINHQIDQLRRMVVRLSRLVEISVTLNSTLELDRLLQFIIRSAADLLESEAASILLVDEHTQDLYLAAATGITKEKLAKLPVPKEGSLAGTVYSEDRPLILNEVFGALNGLHGLGVTRGKEIRSLIGVPLRIREQAAGVLQASNKRAGIFDEGDLQTLTNIASLAGVAIHNARQLDALNRAYEELGQLDKLKSDFIAIASHELRTPLGLILGNAALLQEMAGDEFYEPAEAVLASAMRMRVLIEDMTNMNMLQVGSRELILARQELQPILQAAHDEINELVEAKGQTLTLDLPQEPLMAVIDEEKLRMALANLLNNAIRFTEREGEISLGLELHGREAWLRVSDNGIGVPLDQQENIFNRFYQVEDHLTRRYDGMGLGLAIVKAIAEAHGGRVWVESAGVNTGATFTIAIPMEP